MRADLLRLAREWSYEVLEQIVLTGVDHLFALLGSVGAGGGAGLLLIFPDGVRKVLIPCLIGYATGTLLGAAFLG